MAKSINATVTIEIDGEKFVRTLDPKLTEKLRKEVEEERDPNIQYALNCTAVFMQGLGIVDCRCNYKNIVNDREQKG